MIKIDSLIREHDPVCPSLDTRQQKSVHFPRRLLPLPAAAPAASGSRGAGLRRAQSAVRRVGWDVDLPLLDLTASLRGQVLDLLLRLQVKHHVSQLLLQLLYRRVFTLTCGEKIRRSASLHRILNPLNHFIYVSEPPASADTEYDTNPSFAFSTSAEKCVGQAFCDVTEGGRQGS